MRVNYRSPNTRWYSGAGIYRRVWLCESPETRFASDGIYISTDGDKVTVSSEVIRPEKMPVQGILIKQTILDAAGKTVSEITSEACACDRSCIPEAVRLDNASYAVTTQNMLVKDHTDWDIENPYLYTLVSELIVNGDIVQKISNTFGFRKIEFTSDEGFFLNGRHVKLHGSCEHHDSGALGAATNRAALRRRLVKLREMGVNAIRTSHNMPAVELMELADEMGFPKDSAYIFRAEWTDYKKAPFVHIFPYWDFNVGQPIDVRVCSNAPRVELFLDGVSQGAFDIDHENGRTLTLNHIIDYRPGELTALAYDEDGHFCANANNRVNISVSGAGRLMGMDNGDSTDYDQYKGTSRRLFSGKLLAIIGARKEAGEILVTIESPGFSAVTVTLNAVLCGTDDGVSAVDNVICRETECSRTDDIPVRKIELCTEMLQFTPDVREINVNPVIKPANETYASEIEYRVTNELGVKTHLGCCSINDDGSVTVKANGNGTFFLRALCKNGTEKYHLISVLKFTAEGLGDAVIDPYEFVCGGLYSRASENIGNGINRGVGFSYEKSWAAYENVDFGSAGSEKITVPIFANTFDPVRIRFYDGIPDEGGELLGDFEYHKTPEWLTYQPETYTLSHKLKGLHTFCMESDCGFKAEGFTFKKMYVNFRTIMQLMPTAYTAISSVLKQML